jgi:hypothetical protein
MLRSDQRDTSLGSAKRRMKFARLLVRTNREPHLVAGESGTGESRPRQRALTLHYSLLAVAASLLESDDILCLGAHVGHDEADSRVLDGGNPYRVKDMVLLPVLVDVGSYESSVCAEVDSLAGELVHVDDRLQQVLPAACRVDVTRGKDRHLSIPRTG